MDYTAPALNRFMEQPYAGDEGILLSYGQWGGIGAHLLNTSGGSGSLPEVPGNFPYGIIVLVQAAILVDVNNVIALFMGPVPQALGQHIAILNPLASFKGTLPPGATISWQCFTNTGAKASCAPPDYLTCAAAYVGTAYDRSR